MEPDVIEVLDPEEVPPARGYSRCASMTPPWWCPTYALRNAVVAAPIGGLLGMASASRKNKGVGFMAGAAFFSLGTWWFFSGRWAR